jgi:hypothetical protein
MHDYPRRPQAAFRLVTGAIVVIGIALGAAGCSSPSSGRTVASLPGHATQARSNGPVTAAQGDQEFVNFARCLRAHGVAEPDPVHVPGHTGLSVQIPTPGPRTNAALAACNHFIAPITSEKQAGAQRELTAWLPALTRYAQCMRGHDIPMLDPSANPTSGGLLNLGNVPGISSDFGRYSPQFRAADHACRHLLPAAVAAHDNGTGP